MKIFFFVLMGLMLLSLIGMILDNDKLSYFSSELYKSCMSGLALYGIIGIININEPTAMDVYKGKTTLEITYKEGVAIDSVVVFKDMEEQQ
mgnify:CR=1 FL=1